MAFSNTYPEVYYENLFLDGTEHAARALRNSQLLLAETHWPLAHGNLSVRLRFELHFQGVRANVMRNSRDVMIKQHSLNTVNLRLKLIN